MNKCRTCTASWQTFWEDANSASLPAYLAYFCLLEVLRESHDLNPKTSSGGAVIEGSCARGKQTFKGNANADTQHIFFLWGCPGLNQDKGLVMDFPIAEEGFYSSLSGWQLEDLLLVQDRAVCAEAILPSTVRRKLCSATDCSVFSVSTGRVAR